MKFKEYKKLLAAVTVSAMIASLPGAAAFAAPLDDFNIFPPTKNETVYVKTDESGASKKIIVSDQLQNVGDADSLSDISSLTDIENIKGEEKFTQSGEKLTWEGEGDDIIYQGEADGELPVSFSITYELDGEPVPPEELAGKSGHLKVTYHYNTDRSQTGGRYIPFLMVTGAVLNHDHFRNVEVSGNGHLESDGQRTIAVGYSVPGIMDFLDIDEDKAEISDKLTLSDDFTFEADVEEYEAPTTGTIATNSIFSDINTKPIDSLKSLKSSLRKLVNSSNELVTGSAALSSGVQELQSNIPALKSGVGQLASGSSDLASGASSLASGASSLNSGINQMQQKVGSSMPTLKNGVSQLASGAKALDKGIAQTAKGAQRVSNGIGSLNENAAKMAAGTDELAAGAQELTDGTKTMAAGVGSAKTYIDQLAAEAGSIDMSSLSEEDQAKLQTVINGLSVVSGQMDPSSAQKLVDGAESLQNGIDQVDAGAQQLVGATAPDSELGQGAAGIADLLSSDGSIGKGASSLRSGLDQLSSGIVTMSSTLTGALGQLSDGSSELANGASGLSDGAGKLKNGIGSLNSKIPVLSSGVGQLSSGAAKLAKGMARFDSEGIDKLVGFMNGDLSDLIGKANRLLKNSQKYNNYSGLAKGMDGSVKFVFIPDKEEEE